jgi:hypothetical protein
MPLTQPLPFADADGGDDVAAELVGLADVAGFVLFGAPHAATDSAVAPVSRGPESDTHPRHLGPFESSAAVSRPAKQRFSPFVAQLNIGWRPIMSQLCIG